ncbi:hypothetical protein HJ590_12055 [Naumannella sp. ID2617S]|nr:hypothetical protein [Naumannella sp. ID2617S]
MNGQHRHEFADEYATVRESLLATVAEHLAGITVPCERARVMEACQHAYAALRALEATAKGAGCEDR